MQLRNPAIDAVPTARVLAALIALALVRVAGSQEPTTRVHRADAIAAAAARGPRLALARADTLAAAAQLQSARAWQNPALGASYSKDAPQYHYTLDIPLDLPYQRRPRIASASASQRAARYRYAIERASVAMEADTTYTRALAARAFAELSMRNARDADSLRRIAVARRDAGDASDLDVALATVTAGQEANRATTDSMAMQSALLDLQSVMGLGAGEVIIALDDSLTAPPVARMVAVKGVLLPVAAAGAQLESASLAVQLERRSVFGAPSLTVGFETGDPSGSGSERLPTVGLALPLPLFNRNGGPIALARAEEARARAALSWAEVQARTELTRAQREQTAALAKVGRDERLVEQANRVAAMALTAYREGAASLPNVLEAQRTARELLAQYVGDLADAWIAEAELRVLTLTAARNAP